MSGDGKEAKAKQSPQEADLPKTLIKRLVKSGLQEAAKERGCDTKEFQISKDSLLAFSEAAKLFIHYLTTTANDVCRERRRQTISADDILSALVDMEFDEFVEPLKVSLKEHRAGVKQKMDKRKEEKGAGKKRKQLEDGDSPMEAIDHAIDDEQDANGGDKNENIDE